MWKGKLSKLLPGLGVSGGAGMARLGVPVHRGVPLLPIPALGVFLGWGRAVSPRAKLSPAERGPCSDATKAGNLLPPLFLLKPQGLLS